MNKKLPSVFANQINKKFNNNDKVFYGNNNTVAETTNNISKEIVGNNINQKINSLFSSPNYVYKAQVKLILKDKTINKTIIGRNKNSLITIENESIPISEIVDIETIKNRP